MNIGDFGTVDREVEAAAGTASVEPDTFTWFGKTIRIRNDISPYSLSRFERRVLDPRLARKGTGQVFVQMWSDAMNELEGWIEPGDFDEFDSLAEQNQVGVEELSKLVVKLYEVLVGRPTRRSSASSDGRSTVETSEDSNGKSSASSPDSSSPVSTPRKRSPAKKSVKAAPAKATRAASPVASGKATG